MKQLSKRMLVLDYIIAVCLLLVFFICIMLNGIFSFVIDINCIEIIICAWIAQLGISTTAYYILIKSEHKIELPMILLNDLPDDIKEKVDLTTIITTVLTSTDN